MRPKASLRFYFLGLAVAALEEFITQGVLKQNYAAWIVPTIIAFVPFLILVRCIGGLLDNNFAEARAVLIYYVAAGGIGLLFEWFVIGLTPWSNPSAPFLAMLIFQLGMFSFWGSVALAPRLLLDRRESVGRVRRWFVRALISGMAVIYVLAFTVPREIRFPATIAAVLFTFLALNISYHQYLRALRTAG
ncbi:MAG: hypothetical protein HYY24_21580 [Verrucomicrobia bacterium]|nr:hypothetical protein [Verrucomicrobiota bacterium]